MSRRLVPSPASTTNRARCFSGSHSSTDGGRRNPVWRSIVRKLFIGTTFAAMENHRTDSIPNDSYPVKSDRLLVHRIMARAAQAKANGENKRADDNPERFTLRLQLYETQPPPLVNYYRSKNILKRVAGIQ